MADLALAAKSLRKTYSDGVTDLEVLKGIDLEIRKGETVALMGPSGAGKSTLLHILGLMDQPSGGELSVMGQDAKLLSEKGKDQLRNRQVGFLFQFHYLLPGLTLLENAALPLKIGGKSNAESLKEAAEILSAVGLSHRMHHIPSRVSGGEQQRAALARALVNKPNILICDEPTGNLDLERGREIQKLIWELAKAHGSAVIVATHNLELAESADRILRITDGKIAGN